MNPKYPIYIVSKNRWESQFTSRALDALGVEHFVIVEEDQLDDYQRLAPSRAAFLVLDKQFQREYDTCDDLGDSKGKGPGPARNFAWALALERGAAWHWVMDDNITRFARLNRNLKVPVTDGTIFACMEDFVERYENIAMAGPSYDFFTKRKQHVAPFIPNTRIYSCNFIRNDLPYRWRGRYNEDTDLSLRMLKDRWCTVQFNAFLQYKMGTQVLGGGNTQEFYAIEGTKPKSEMQVNLHPDVSRLVWKFGRWHHSVDYRPFARNRLRLKRGLELPTGYNEYGMVYQEQTERGWHAVEVPSGR